MMITRVTYTGVQKHGSYYVHKGLEDVSVTCPECSYCRFGNGFDIQLSMNDGIQSHIHNVFTLKCYRCGCVFTIKTEKE